MPGTISHSNVGTAELAQRRHWLGLPVNLPVEGSFAQILNQLPHFGRQPFTMSSVNGSEFAFNAYMDMIYRIPACQGDSSIPVGIVSKNYRLVDHSQVLQAVGDVLVDLGIDSHQIHVRGEWTAYGERARFSLIFPAEDRFSVQLGAQDEMRFRIEIVNSVEGSCRLMVIV